MKSSRFRFKVQVRKMVLGETAAFEGLPRKNPTGNLGLKRKSPEKIFCPGSNQANKMLPRPSNKQREAAANSTGIGSVPP